MFNAERLYYSITVGVIVCYLLGLWIGKLPILTFTTVNYFLAIILAVLPGYNASIGRYLPPALERGFDQTIYLIYVSYALILTAAALLGQISAKHYALVGAARPNLNARVGLVIIFIVIYGCAYLYWVPAIPLKNLLSGASGFGGASEERIQITHQLGLLGDRLPWPFRFWRTVLQFWPVIICFLLALMRQTGIKVPRLVYWLCIMGMVFLLTFTLEKALVVQFAFGLLIIPNLLYKKLKFRKLALIATVCVLLSMATIAIFMGGDTSELASALSYRISQQTSSIYVQIQYVREHGFLGLQGIQFPLGSKILGSDYYIDLGRESYATIFPDRAEAGLVGSAAGLSLAELYFAFGWFGVPVFAFLIFAYSWLDIVWRNGFMHSHGDIGFLRISSAFYVLGMTLFSLTYVSSVFVIFSLPFGLSAQCILIAILYVFLVKLCSLRILKLGL